VQPTNRRSESRTFGAEARRTLHEFVTHYHRERNHQGLANELIDAHPEQRSAGPVRRRQRVGGILSYYYTSAA
jgi:putative transposase